MTLVDSEVRVTFFRTWNICMRRRVAGRWGFFCSDWKEEKRAQFAVTVKSRNSLIYPERPGGGEECTWVDNRFIEEEGTLCYVRLAECSSNSAISELRM